MSEVVTRFPPSPTGLLQAGNVRTAIFNYLFARKHGGKFIVRIEDTDKVRSKKEYEDNIVATLEWLGLNFDEFYRQSDRLARHKEVTASLIERDLAYVSKEEPTEPGQRPEVIRFRNPNTTVSFLDVIRGEISFDTTELGDFIIARSFDEPLYHLGVVVDDFDAGVTHIIRGEDHISNTPRQILLQHAIGQREQPIYAHLPLLLGTDRSKLSKRKGARAIAWYRDEGYVPEAVINYLALLGWHPHDEQEIFSLDQLIESFELARVQKGGAVFDETKLAWFNHEHLKRFSQAEYSARLEEYMVNAGVVVPQYFSKISPLLQERYQTLKEASDAIAGNEYDFMNEAVVLSRELLVSGAKADAPAVKMHLQKLAELLESLADEDFSAEVVKGAVFEYATAQGRACVLWPMRTALSGKEKSPDPFTLAGLLGKKVTQERIVAAASIL